MLYLASIFFILLLVPCRSYAQDIITFTDGRQVEASILEVTHDEIKYKKFQNSKSPIYTVYQQKVKTIHYENGDVEEYGKNVESAKCVIDQEDVVDSPELPMLVNLFADAENKVIISRSQRNLKLTKTKSVRNKVSENVTINIALTDDSIISNEQVKADFIKGGWTGVSSLWLDFIIINKLDIPIYVDLGNCFSVKSNGVSRCYYDPSKITSVIDEQSGGANFNLGAITSALGIGGVLGTLASGLSIGGGASFGTSTTYHSQRFIVVGPGGRGYISQWKYHNEQNISEGEFFSVGDIMKNAVLKYSPENSTHKTDYYVTYSTDPSFKTYSVLKFTTYISHAIGHFDVSSNQSMWWGKY